MTGICSYSIGFAADVAQLSAPDAYRRLISYRRGEGIGVAEAHRQAFALLVRNIAPKNRWRLCQESLFPNWYPGYGHEDGPSCWIARKGLVYPVVHAGHSDFAETLGLRVRILEQAGWIHVSGGRMDILYPDKVTGAQKAAMAALPGKTREHVNTPHGSFDDISEEHRALLKQLDRVPRDDPENYAANSAFWNMEVENVAA